MNPPLALMMIASTAGLGAPQFDEGGTFVLKVINVVLIGLAIVVLWKNAFAKKPAETLIGPSPLSVKAHEELVTRREFAEVKARTIAVEHQLREVKECMHATEIKLLEAGHEREEKLMARINLLVPEVVKALDRTDRSKGGRA